jgi:hypothetical protein
MSSIRQGRWTLAVLIITAAVAFVGRIGAADVRSLASNVRLEGVVELIPTPDGRSAAMVVDRGFGDGFVDAVYWIRSTQRLDAFALRSATIEARPDELVVDGRHYSVFGGDVPLFELQTLSPSVWHRRALSLAGIRESVSTVGWISAEGDVHVEETCATGGQGASSASISGCVYIPTGGSVSCGSEYYACCNCEPAAHCHCHPVI